MPNILVVDEDPDIEEILRQSAAEGNVPTGGSVPTVGDAQAHTFSFARSDAEALSVISNTSDLDLAIVSIDGGKTTGMELFHNLNGTTLRIPRIALTANHDLVQIRKAMNDGAADFLTKPIASSDLFATIDKVYADCERRRKAWKDEAELAAIRKEVDIAGEIQKRILPTQFPERADLDISAQIKPAREMGGDFYDFFELDEHRLGLVVADVSGKGVPAAFFMAVARTLIRATALTGVAPDTCLEQANSLLVRHNIPGMFVSVFYGVLDTRTWIMEYANGGHLPPYHISASDDVVRPLEGGDGVILGVEEGHPYRRECVELATGDALFFYTDGLTEAFDVNRNQFTDERLLEYLAGNRSLSAHALAENVFAFVNLFTGDAPQSDDITSLVIKRF